MGIPATRTYIEDRHEGSHRFARWFYSHNRKRRESYKCYYRTLNFRNAPRVAETYFHFSYRCMQVNYMTNYNALEVNPQDANMAF